MGKSGRAAPPPRAHRGGRGKDSPLDGVKLAGPDGSGQHVTALEVRLGRHRYDLGRRAERIWTGLACLCAQSRSPIGCYSSCMPTEEERCAEARRMARIDAAFRDGDLEA